MKGRFRHANERHGPPGCRSRDSAERSHWRRLIEQKTKRWGKASNLWVGSEKKKKKKKKKKKEK